MNEAKALRKLNRVIEMLKWTYGLAAIIVGADKFFHFLVNWNIYFSPLITQYIPYPVHQMMYAVGIIEIVVGIIILSNLTRLGAYIVAAWFFVIVADLISMNMFYDIALRDLVLGIGALALGKLISVRKELTH